MEGTSVKLVFVGAASENHLWQFDTTSKTTLTRIRNPELCTVLLSNMEITYTIMEPSTAACLQQRRYRLVSVRTFEVDYCCYL